MRYLKPIVFVVVAFSLLSQLALAGRYYDPEIGRFTTPDPALEKYHPNKIMKINNGILYSVNPYNYALNNPLRYVDPTGEIVMDAQQENSFKNAFESAVVGWYTKLYRAQHQINSTPGGYLGNPRQETFLDKPVSIQNKFPTAQGAEAFTMAVLTKVLGAEKFDPFRYYADNNTYGKFILNATAKSIDFVRVIDPSMESVDPDQTLYGLKLLNSEGEVVGRVEMNSEQYQNYLKLIEQAREQANSEEKD